MSKPWLEHDDWPRTLRSGSRRAMYAAWGFAGFWNLVSLPLAFVIPDEVAGGNRLALIGLVFPAVGIGIILYAIKRTREWRHYGATELTLDPYPGSLGGHVGGVVTINGAALAQRDADDAVEVTLECVHSYMSGSGEDRSRRSEVKWQARGPGLLIRAGSAVQLQFRFEVPANLPASERKEGDAYHYWRVHVGNDVQPVALDRTFEIGVFPTVARAEQITTDTTALGRAAAAEELNSAIADFDSAQLLRDKYGMTIQQGGDRLRLILHSGRQKGMALGMFVIGGVFAGVGWLVPPDDFAAIMIKWGFGLFGWLMVGASSYIPFNALEVRVGPDEISRVRSWFGMVIKRQRVRPSELSEFEIVKGASTQSGDHTTIYYRLIGKGSFGEFRLLESVSDKQLVEAVRDRVMHCAGLRRN